MDEVTISGEVDSPVLTFSEFDRPENDGWCSFRVTLTGRGLSATLTIKDHSSLSVAAEPALGDRTGTLGLTRLVAHTAADYAGWEGERRWDSLEREFAVSATFERRGYAAIKVDLQSEWHLCLTIRLDVEQRKRLASELDVFFHHADLGDRAV